MSDVNKLLEVNLSVFVIDMIDKPLSLSGEVLEKFIPPKRGIYLYNSIKPLLNLEDNKYFFENGNTVITLDDVKNCKGYILDINGNVVLSDSRIKRIEKLLLNEPNIPVIAIDFIINSIENFILTSTINYSKILFHDNTNLLKDYREFLDKDNKLVYENQKDLLDFVDSGCSFLLTDIYNELNDFINGDIYNIYEFERKGNLLIINKKHDYRIIQYYKQLEIIKSLKNELPNS